MVLGMSMYSPSKTSINPGVAFEFEGVRYYVGSAQQALDQFRAREGNIPEREQLLLQELQRHRSELVNGGSLGLGINLGQIKSYLMALNARWGLHAPLTNLSEAKRRAAICKDCPFHGGMPQGCFGCHGIGSLMMAVPAGVEEDLGTCLKCGCVLNTKVWLSEEVLLTDERQIDFPDFCWAKR